MKQEWIRFMSIQYYRWTELKLEKPKVKVKTNLIIQAKKHFLKLKISIHYPKTLKEAILNVLGYFYDLNY
jgi:hypothetical protein